MLLFLLSGLFLLRLEQRRFLGLLLFQEPPLTARDQDCLPPDCGECIITEPNVQIGNSG